MTDTEAIELKPPSERQRRLNEVDWRAQAILTYGLKRLFGGRWPSAQ